LSPFVFTLEDDLRDVSSIDDVTTTKHLRPWFFE
jgi:hypothetical protein